MVLLHGFSGTGRGWDHVRAHLDPARYNAITPDLRGHGVRAAHRPVTLDGVLRDLRALVPEPCELVGYSMGGRIALRLALTHPQTFSRLVLVATSAGIEDAREREDRHHADCALADRVEKMGMEEWIAEWTAMPIFEGTPPEALAAWKEDLARTPTPAVADALRGLSSGAMHPVWDRLDELTMPVDVVVGERDEKYREFGERLAQELPRASLHVLPGAGHGLPREAPEALAGVLSGNRQ